MNSSPEDISPENSSSTKSVSEISAIDFDIALAALRRLVPQPIAATELRALAKVSSRSCVPTRRARRH